VEPVIAKSHSGTMAAWRLVPAQLHTWAIQKYAGLKARVVVVVSLTLLLFLGTTGSSI
jgi:hypothetical protein